MFRTKCVGVVEFIHGEQCGKGFRMFAINGHEVCTRIALGCFASIVLAYVSLAVEADSTPPQLSFIDDVIGEEQEAVDAVRRFDRAQQAMMQWDFETAQSLGARGETDDADERVESARHRLQLIDQAYRMLLNHYPENARALTYHGELLYDQMGDPTTAIKNWRLATAFDESLSTPHNNLGLHYCHTGNYRMGLRELDKALKYDPDHADYHFNIAQIYLVNGPQVEEIRGWSKKKVYREAMKHSKRAAELAPADYDLSLDYAVNFFAAENHGVNADWKAAAEAWSVARGNARNDTEEFFTWLNEARVWIEHNNRTRAEPCLKSALALMPDSRVALQLLEEVRGEGA